MLFVTSAKILSIYASWNFNHDTIIIRDAFQTEQIIIIYFHSKSISVVFFSWKMCYQLISNNKIYNLIIIIVL